MHFDNAHRMVRAALSHYGVDEQSRVEFVKHRENHVFRVDEPGGRSYAVRLHRPGYRDDAEIATELTYLRTLAQAGVAVPHVVPARDGALVCLVTVEGEQRLVSMQHWIEDAHPFGDIDGALSGRHDPPAQAFTLIGRALGSLHAAAAEIGVPEWFRRASWDADGLAGNAPVWGDPAALDGLTTGQRDVVRRGVAHVRARLDALGTETQIFGVIHADATPENVLETADGVVLIDFDDFGTGWYVFDLVTAIFHHARNPRYARFENAMLDGYSRARTITAQELSAWDDFMLARGLTYLGWAAQRPGDPASEFISSTVVPWVVEIAEALVAGDRAPWRTDNRREEDR